MLKSLMAAPVSGRLAYLLGPTLRDVVKINQIDVARLVTLG